MSEQPAANTDRELYRENAGEPSDYYNDSVHVTAQGSIGMNVGGHVIVLSIAEWHRRAWGWNAQSVQEAGFYPDDAYEQAREEMYRRFRDA